MVTLRPATSSTCDPDFTGMGKDPLSLHVTIIDHGTATNRQGAVRRRASEALSRSAPRFRLAPGDSLAFDRRKLVGSPGRRGQKPRAQRAGRSAHRGESTPARSGASHPGTLAGTLRRPTAPRAPRMAADPRTAVAGGGGEC